MRKSQKASSQDLLTNLINPLLVGPDGCLESFPSEQSGFAAPCNATLGSTFARNVRSLDLYSELVHKPAATMAVLAPSVITGVSGRTGSAATRFRFEASVSIAILMTPRMVK